MQYLFSRWTAALVVGAALAAPSQAALVYSGVIKVTDTGSQAVLGYVSQAQNSFGEFGVAPNVANALAISFVGAPSFSISAINSPSPLYPYFGAIRGFSSTSSDLGAGSFNYTYLGGTEETAVGSAPVAGGNSFSAATGIPETIESAIWSLSGNELLAQWINTDLGSPSTSIAYTQGLLALTGDMTAFTNAFVLVRAVAFSFEGSVVDTSQVPEPASWALVMLALVGVAGVRRKR